MFNLELLSNSGLTSSQKYFGIDLGTTYTLMAYVNSSEVNLAEAKIPVKLIKFKQVSPFEIGGTVHDEKVASIIAIYNNKPFCGNKLYELKGHPDFTYRENLFYHWKLDLGIERNPLYPDAVIPDLETPQKVASKVLNYCRIQFLKDRNTKLSNTIITVPASFQQNQRRDVLNASKLANIETHKRMLVDEPNAAFSGYFFNRLSNEEKKRFVSGGTKNVLVFDIGGGTCDLSILKVRFDKNKGLLIANKAICRYNDLGGQDLDQMIAEEILFPEFLQQEDLDAESISYREITRQLLPQLGTIAEKLKMGICDKISVRYGDKDLSKKNLSKIDFSLNNQELIFREEIVEINRASINGLEWFELVEKLFASGVHSYTFSYQDKQIRSISTTINDVLEKAGLRKDELDYVLMAGGSSLNPILTYKIRKIFSYSSLLLPNQPDKLIAEGAAIFSYLYYHHQIPLIRPIASDNIGIELKGGKFQTLITQGSELPLKVEFPQFAVQDVSKDSIIIPICLNEVNNLIQEINIPLTNKVEIDSEIIIHAKLTEDKILALQIYLDGHQIHDFTLDNPFFFGSLSRHKADFEDISKKLLVARQERNLKKEKQLQIDLMRQYFDVGNHHELVRLAEEYIEKYESDNHTVWNLLFLGNDGIGRSKAARIAIEKAISLDSTNIVLHYNYSLLLEEQENLDAALNYLISLDDGLKREAHISCQIIILKRDLRKNDEAKSLANEILSKYEDNVDGFPQFVRINLIPKISVQDKK